MYVKFGGGAGGGEATRIIHALVTEDVQLPHLDVRGRQARQVAGTRWCRVRGHLWAADRVAEQRVPAGVVVVVRPESERQQSRVGFEVPVVQHRIDEDLFGD